MAAPFGNVYHLRTVADTSSKACYVCLKPTTKVLITPDNKDFFYICLSHLNDKGFASPVIDEAAEAAKKKKEQMDREIEKIKQEYEEKQRKKKAKGNDKDKKKDDDDGGKAEKERDDKIKAIEAGGANPKGTTDAVPRVYALHRTFYQMRIDRIRKLEQAKREQQRMRDPNLFPSVPKGDIA